MPLPILLSLVICGIAGIALALHLLGLSNAPTFTEQSAHDTWLRHRPDDIVRDITLSSDKRAARVTTDAGRGILWQMGADTCARMLNGTEQIAARGTTVTLRRKDYTAPSIRLNLSAQDKEEWANWMTQT